MIHTRQNLSLKFGWASSPYTAGMLAILMAVILSLRITAPPTRILTWDVFGYYLYLPATCIYDDPGLKEHEWLDNVFEKYIPSATFYQVVHLENGNRLIKYPLGSALLMSPFFGIAHGLAYLFDYPPDGFSPPYQWVLAFGGLIYAFLGLFFLGLSLRTFFKDGIAALVLGLVVLGTNYLQLISWDGTLLSHNFEFFLYSLLIWMTIRWHQKPAIGKSVLIGLLFGMIVITRPSEIVVIAIPVLYGVYNLSSLRKKVRFLVSNIPHLLVIVFFTMLVGLIQMSYWKVVSGHWFFYSYINPGEGFDFLSPHTIPFLFSFRKGWLIYTPLMVLALLGLIKVYQMGREWFWALLIFLILDVYIVSSWTCWWYAGGSFSSRSMLPAYTLFAFPLAYLLEWASRKRWLTLVLGTLLALMVVLNLFQSWQWKVGIISKERMTKEYYWRVFGRTMVTESDRQYLSVERSIEGYDELKNTSGYSSYVLYKNAFVDDESQESNDSLGMILDPQQPFSPGPDITYFDLTQSDHAWIQARADVYIPEGYSCNSPVLVATFHHKGEAYAYKAKPLSNESLGKPGYHELKLDYLTPEVRKVVDNLKVYVWQPDTCPVRVKSLEVIVHEPLKEPKS